MNSKSFIFKLIVLLSGLFASIAQAQQSTGFPSGNDPFPLTLLSQADSTLNVALKQKNSPLIIRSLLQRSSALMTISLDSIPSLIKQIESICSKTDKKAEQSILQSLLAQLYQSYYNLDQRRFDSRQTIEGDFPENIDEWSGTQFISKIHQLTLQSVAPVSELQKINSVDYIPAIAEGKDSRLLRPTLFDFLAYRAIERMEQMNLFTVNNYFPQDKIEIPMALLPISGFIQLQLNEKPVQIKQTVLSIYQQLLRFHQQDNNMAALIMTNIKRLKYVNSNSYLRQDVLINWRKELDDYWNFYQQYRENPYSVEILIYFRTLTTIPDKFKTEAAIYLKKLKQAQEEAVKKFSDYERINCLKNEIKQSESPYAYTELYRTRIFPGEKTPFNLRYKNIRKLNIKCYRLETSVLEQKQQEMKPKNDTAFSAQQKIYDIVIPISDTLSLTITDKTISLPALSPGFYRLLFYSDSGTEPVYTLTTYVTGLFSICKSIDKEQREIIVTDAKTGKPVSGARIDLYTSPKYDTYESIGNPLYTDKQGIAICDIKEAKGYVVSYRNDAYLPYVQLPMVQRPYEATNHRISLFTDRSIYRPGQRIQFSGILYAPEPNERSVLPDRPVNIKLINAQKVVIYENKLISDSLGAFYGDIVIPPASLTGDFSLTAEYGQAEGYTNIDVSEYKRPTFKIEFRKPNPGYSFKTPVTLSGQAITYAGYALPNTLIKYKIVREEHFLHIWNSSSEQVATGEAITNDQGDFTLSFQPSKTPNDQNLSKTVYQYRIVAEATSPSGDTQSGSALVHVGDSPLIIHLPDEMYINKDNAHKRVRLTVLSLNGDTLRLPCKYTLYSLYDNQNIDDLKPIDSLKLNKQVMEGELLSGDSLNFTDWCRLPSGPYRMFIRVEDENGNVVNNEIDMNLYSYRDKRPPLVKPLWMPEKYTNILPGETKEIFFGSSYQQAYCYVELFAGDELVKQEVVKLNNSMMHYPVTYNTAWQGDLNISVTLIKKADIFVETGSFHPNKQERYLTIQTSVFRDKLKPGASEEWTFTVKDSKGNPVISRFLASMYDASLKTIRRHDWNFYPIAFRRGHYPRWNRPSFSGSDLMFASDKPVKYSCPEFDYDRLNLDVKIPDSKDFYVRGYGSEYIVTGLPLQKKVKVLGAIANYDALNGTKENLFTSENREQHRTNFEETAFFYPNLLTDKEGNVSFRFTVPESNTEWQFMSLAYTKDLLFGTLDKKAVSSKPLMVSPNMPRFIRQGDEVVIPVLLINNGTALQEGQICFELFNPYTDSVLTAVSKPFSLNDRQTGSQSFVVHAPDNLDIVGVRVRAATKEFSDGEQHLLPVLPSRTLVTETLPFTITTAGEHEFTQKRLIENQSETLKNHRLTLEYTDNPFWFVVQALPSLSETNGQNVLDILTAFYSNTISGGIIKRNPKIKEAIRICKTQAGNRETLLSNLQKNESLKTILLSESPWVLNTSDMNGRMQRLSALFDSARISQTQSIALNRLKTLQTVEGGWSWLPNMRPSQAITLSILESMDRLKRLKMIAYDQDMKEIQVRALYFIDMHLIENMPADSSVVLNHENLSYLYVRTLFLDHRLEDKAIPYFNKLIDKLRNDWPTLPLYDKVLAALTLNRFGPKNFPTAILSTLTETATRTKELGMFWQNNRASQKNEGGAIRLHTLMMNAYHEIDPDSPLIDEMKQWLLMQKQIQDWGCTSATADAVYALLMTGTDRLTPDKERSTIKWGENKIKPTGGDLLTGYLQQSKQGAEINAEAATIRVYTPVNRPAWGGLYWQYFEEFGRIAKTGNGLSIEKLVFVEAKIPGGSKLIPIGQDSLKSGQKLVIRLAISSDRDFEFVHLRDQRAACFEQSQQESGYIYQDGVGYYRENRDACTNFFFNFLPKGKYVLSYEVWVDRPGTYSNGSTSVQCLYAPQYSAIDQGEIITVK